jgi:hypothetical protein
MKHIFFSFFLLILVQNCLAQRDTLNIYTNRAPNVKDTLNTKMNVFQKMDIYFATLSYPITYYIGRTKASSAKDVVIQILIKENMLTNKYKGLLTDSAEKLGRAVSVLVIGDSAKYYDRVYIIGSPLPFNQARYYVDANEQPQILWKPGVKPKKSHYFFISFNNVVYPDIK